MLAAIFRNPELVQLILSKGADVRAVARDGTTALHSVFEELQYECGAYAPVAPIVQLLLAAGASPTAADREGRLPAQRLECAVAAVLKKAEECKKNGYELDIKALLTDAEAARRMLSG